MSVIDDNQLGVISRAFFHRALKLQIGCGAEPTLYPHLEKIVADAVGKGIPYISLTTNGQLLANDASELKAIVESGLNEITLSAHGLTPQNYEYFMPGAKWEKFIQLLDILKDIKLSNPQFCIRLNYTFNSKNVEDLNIESFDNVWKEVIPDIVQLRPAQNIGGTEWTDYDMADVSKVYAQNVEPLISHLRSRGVSVIAPDATQLMSVDDEQTGASAVIEDVSYCYVSPEFMYKEDFNRNDTYESYHRRNKTLHRLFKSVIKGSNRKRHVSKKMNYTVS